MAAVKSEETPLLELSGVAQRLPKNTNCLACPEDGKYLCLGHSRGLSVWCASSFTRVAEWLRARLEVTLIQMTTMADTTYLLGTVDDMGVARVLAFNSNRIHLLSVINVMEDVNERSVCSTFELYKGGHYGAASVSCSGATWLEVLQFPLAAWLKELQTAASQNKQDQNLPEDVCVKWSPVTVLIKITPPNVPSGTTMDSSVGVGRTTDYFTHCFYLDVIRSSSYQKEKLSFGTDAGKTKEKRGISRGCTSHFLLPCGQFSGKSKVNFQPDLGPMPDVLWPNAKEIFCSATSRCTRYIGLGLEDAMVCIWDRLSGAPLQIVSMLAENSALLSMQFMDNWTTSVHDSQVLTAELVHVLVLCKSGAIYTITAGRGAETCTVQLTERPKDSRDLPSVIMSVPFLRAVFLVVQKNGEMLLQDAINKTPLCFLAPPASHRFASPCNPIFALNAKHRSLFIRGDQKTSGRVSSKKSSKLQLLVFKFEESELIKQYVVSHPDSPGQQSTLSQDTLEKICALYLQQRVLSVDERNKDFEKTWRRLQETAVTIQQRQQGNDQKN